MLDFQQDVQTLAQAVLQGGVILYPTDTVWGIGCDVHQAAAAERIMQIKQRPAEKKFVVLVDSVERLKQYVAHVPDKALRLIEYYERPLTIVYDKLQMALPPIVLAEDGSLAIRVTRDPFCKALINSVGKALISTSANLSGEPFPTQFAEISTQIKQGVDAIAQHRQNDISTQPPSAIVRVIDGEDLIFIRK